MKMFVLFDEMQIDFGQQVHDARRKCGLTQEKTAEILNYGLSSIRRIEQGQGDRGWQQYVMLSELFRIDVAELRTKYIVPHLENRIYELNLTGLF